MLIYRLNEEYVWFDFITKALKLHSNLTINTNLPISIQIRIGALDKKMVEANLIGEVRDNRQVTLSLAMPAQPANIYAESVQ